MSGEVTLPKKIVLKPIIISNNKKMVLKSPNLLANLNFPVRQYKEEVIYESRSCDFLKGESQEVRIVNRLNLFNKSCRTIAHCTNRGTVVETTSDSVSSAIGQKNYETVLSALSSIFNEETKVRGILSLLSAQKKFNTVGIQTDINLSDTKKTCMDMESQTEDCCQLMFLKEKSRKAKRMRRQPLTPYVVTEEPKVKKLVIKIDDVKKDLNSSEKVCKEKEDKLPDLKLVVDEDSNISDSSVGNLSVSSWPSLPGVLENPHEILTEIDKVTDKTLNSTEIKLQDGSTIMIPVKPEDVFHVATPEILKNVTNEERMKLVWYQCYIDFKMCLEQNEDGYYPLHLAVMNNDVDLVRRQCASLRAKRESVDILAAGLTALQMAVRQNSIACTSMLLQNGADPLLCDQERRCSLHLSAETDSPHLRCLLTYCDKNPRSVLMNNLEFSRPELESITDEQLKKYLWNRISEMFDEQGYTPLMTAAEAAIPTNVSLLAARAGALIDAAAPDCGATALYRVVAKACLHHKETNAATTPEKFLKTIEILLENGADPSIENHSGSSVNTLLTEFNISDLSMTIANKMTAMRHGRFASEKMMLYKHNDGRIGYKDINNEKTNVHAIITVDLPKIQPKPVTKCIENNVNDNIASVENTKVIDSPITSSEVNSNETVGFNGITGKKDFKLEHTYLKKVLDDNVSLKELSASRLVNAIKNAKEKHANEGDTKLQQFGNIVLKPTNNVHVNVIDNVNEKNIAPKKALTLSVTGVKDGNLGNVALKRLSSGKMVAITQARVDKISARQQINAANLKANKFKIIKVKPFTNNINNPSILLNTESSPNKIIEMNTDLNDEIIQRSAKERKTENVVIVENVQLKGFALPNIIKPGTSKTAKPRDIVISSPKVNEPNIIIGKQCVETLDTSKKRKLNP